MIWLVLKRQKQNKNIIVCPRFDDGRDHRSADDSRHDSVWRYSRRCVLICTVCARADRPDDDHDHDHGHTNDHWYRGGCGARDPVSSTLPLLTLAAVQNADGGANGRPAAEQHVHAVVCVPLLGSPTERATNDKTIEWRITRGNGLGRPKQRDFQTVPFLLLFGYFPEK